MFSLLGVNGAGKTTTIKMLCCLTKPTEGDAFVGGYSVIKEWDAVKRLIGVSPQETAVAPNLSVRENLELICGIHGFSREKTQEKIGELAGRLIPEDILHRKAGKLSGGQQRRVSIAMALISEPRILFLDEPTLGLDVLARRELWEVIRSLREKIHILAGSQFLLHLTLERSVEPAFVNLLVLKEIVRLNVASELFRRKEIIVHPVLLLATRRPAGGTHAESLADFLEGDSTADDASTCFIWGTDTSACGE